MNLRVFLTVTAITLAIVAAALTVHFFTTWFQLIERSIP